MGGYDGPSEMGGEGGGGSSEMGGEEDLVGEQVPGNRLEM